MPGTALMHSFYAIVDDGSGTGVYKLFVEETILYDKQYKILISIMRDVTEREMNREKDNELRKQTIEVTDKVIDKQMRVVQEIASLLGETTAETKVALTKLKDAMLNDE